jgi:hypothetical protein
MVVYFCKFCNFSSNIKSHYNRHLKTKKHSVNEENECNKNYNKPKQTKKKYNQPKTNQKNPKNFAKGPFFFEKNVNFLKNQEKNETKMKKNSENISDFENNSENISDFETNHENNSENISDFETNYEKNSDNISNFETNLEKKNKNDNNIINLKNKKNIECEYCHKTFTHMNSLYRHKNGRCKNKNTDIDKQQLLKLIDRDYLIEYVKKEKIIESVLNTDDNALNIVNVNKITNIQNNNIHNNNIHNNNIQNNIININPLGQEDISFITEEIRLKILENLYMAVPELIKVVHDRDCNRNFFIKNINKQIMGYVDKDLKIKYDDYKNVIEKIIDDNIDRLHLFYVDLKNKVRPECQDKLNKVIKLSNDRELNDKYNSNIKYYVLDNSHKNKKIIKDIVEN